MSLLVTGDLHLNNNPRDRYRHDFQPRLRALAKKHKVSAVLINGDLTDEKDHHPATLVNEVVDEIHELAQQTLVIINKGNHDYSSLHTTPFFAFLKRIENVQWINEPTWWGKWLILPHSPNPERDWVKVKLRDAELILAHQTFTGARNERGRELTGVPKSLLPKGVPVVAGDVHVPQKDGQVVYTGAPYTIDFGDDYDPRVLLVEGNEVTSIPCPGPQKRLVQCRPEDLEAAGKVLVARGDIVKVRLEVDTHEYAHWADFRTMAKDWAQEAGVTLHQVQPLAKEQPKKKKVARKVATVSDAEIIAGYVKRKGADKQTLKIGQELL